MCASTHKIFGADSFTAARVESSERARDRKREEENVRCSKQIAPLLLQIPTRVVLNPHIHLLTITTHTFGSIAASSSKHCRHQKSTTQQPAAASSHHHPFFSSCVCICATCTLSRGHDNRVCECLAGCASLLAVFSDAAVSTSTTKALLLPTSLPFVHLCVHTYI